MRAVRPCTSAVSRSASGSGRWHLAHGREFAPPLCSPLTAQMYYERYSPFPYGSREWKTVYNQRVAAERAFGRLKGQRRLEWLKHRGLQKVQIHAALSLLAHNAAVIFLPRAIKKQFEGINEVVVEYDQQKQRNRSDTAVSPSFPKLRVPTPFLSTE